MSVAKHFIGILIDNNNNNNFTGKLALITRLGVTTRLADNWCPETVSSLGFDPWSGFTPGVTKTLDKNIDF